MGPPRPPAFSIFGKWCPGALEWRLGVPGYSPPSGHAGPVFPLGERGQRHHRRSAAPRSAWPPQPHRTSSRGGSPEPASTPRSARRHPARTCPATSRQRAMRHATPYGYSQTPHEVKAYQRLILGDRHAKRPGPLLELAGSGTLTGGRTARWSALAPVVQRQRRCSQKALSVGSNPTRGTTQKAH
jgi:hypothetical protein